jgi:transcription termination factor NusB
MLIKNMITNELPNNHKRVLQITIKLLNKISKNASENMMTSDNLAMVFSPNLIKKKTTEKLSMKEMEDFLKESPYCSSIVKEMIENYETIFKEIETECEEYLLKKLTKNKRPVIRTLKHVRP